MTLFMSIIGTAKDAAGIGEIGDVAGSGNISGAGAKNLAGKFKSFFSPPTGKQGGSSTTEDSPTSSEAVEEVTEYSNKVTKEQKEAVLDVADQLRADNQRALEFISGNSEKLAKLAETNQNARTLMETQRDASKYENVLQRLEKEGVDSISAKDLKGLRDFLSNRDQAIKKLTADASAQMSTQNVNVLDNFVHQTLETNRSFWDKIRRKETVSHDLTQRDNERMRSSLSELFHETSNTLSIIENNAADLSKKVLEGGEEGKEAQALLDLREQFHEELITLDKMRKGEQVTKEEAVKAQKAMHTIAETTENSTVQLTTTVGDTFRKLTEVVSDQSLSQEFQTQAIRDFKTHVESQVGSIESVSKEYKELKEQLKERDRILEQGGLSKEEKQRLTEERKQFQEDYRVKRDQLRVLNRLERAANQDLQMNAEELRKFTAMEQTLNSSKISDNQTTANLREINRQLEFLNISVDNLEEMESEKTSAGDTFGDKMKDMGQSSLGQSIIGTALEALGLGEIDDIFGMSEMIGGGGLLLGMKSLFGKKNKGTDALADAADGAKKKGFFGRMKDKVGGIFGRKGGDVAEGAADMAKKSTGAVADSAKPGLFSRLTSKLKGGGKKAAIIGGGLAALGAAGAGIYSLFGGDDEEAPQPGTPMVDKNGNPVAGTNIGGNVFQGGTHYHGSYQGDNIVGGTTNIEGSQGISHVDPNLMVPGLPLDRSMAQDSGGMSLGTKIVGGTAALGGAAYLGKRALTSKPTQTVAGSIATDVAFEAAQAGGMKVASKVAGKKATEEVTEAAAEAVGKKAISGAVTEATEAGAKKGAGVAAKVASTTAVKETGEAVAKAGGKSAAKAGAKAAGKGLLKSAAKKLPGVGLLFGLGFGINRLMEGDVLGAGLEVASGAASIIPGIGTAASAAIDIGLGARDVKKEIDAADKTAKVATNVEPLRKALDPRVMEQAKRNVDTAVQGVTTEVNATSKALGDQASQFAQSAEKGRGVADSASESTSLFSKSLTTLASVLIPGAGLVKKGVESAWDGLKSGWNWLTGKKDEKAKKGDVEGQVEAEQKPKGTKAVEQHGDSTVKKAEPEAKPADAKKGWFASLFSSSEEDSSTSKVSSSSTASDVEMASWYQNYGDNSAISSLSQDSHYSRVGEIPPAVSSLRSQLTESKAHAAHTALQSHRIESPRGTTHVSEVSRDHGTQSTDRSHALISQSGMSKEIIQGQDQVISSHTDRTASSSHLASLNNQTAISQSEMQAGGTVVRDRVSDTRLGHSQYSQVTQKEPQGVLARVADNLGLTQLAKTGANYASQAYQATKEFFFGESPEKPMHVQVSEKPVNVQFPDHPLNVSVVGSSEAPVQLGQASVIRNQEIERPVDYSTFKSVDSTIQKMKTSERSTNQRLETIANNINNTTKSVNNINFGGPRPVQSPDTTTRINDMEINSMPG